ncbi:MAG: SDR family oxidoreductase [Actinomycetota bacterium]
MIGGSSGIGLATARGAQDAGARVSIAARNPERLAAARKTLGGHVKTIPVDATSEDEVRRLFDLVDEVDHVATFAGSLAFGRILETDTDQLREGMEGRFWGAANICKHAAPRMNDGGSITLCSGVAGIRSRPGRSMGAASTVAVEAFARATALELAPVRVNAVCPGVIDTPLADDLLGARKEEAYAEQAKRIPLGRVGRAEEVADAVLFLMTNPFVTGTVLVVDGGYCLV